MAYPKLKFIKLGSVWDKMKGGRPYMTRDGMPYASGSFDDDFTIKKGEVLRVFAAKQKGLSSPKFNVILCRLITNEIAPYEKTEESDAAEPEVTNPSTFVPDGDDTPF